jgi:phosphoglycolate phosphatase-like HAD superfamily hydrolase
MSEIYHKLINREYSYNQFLQAQGMNMPLSINRIQAICFDIDGTLRETDDHYVARFERLLPFVSAQNKTRVARAAIMRLESPLNGFLHIADILGLDPIIHKFFDIVSPSSSNTDKDAHLVSGANATLSLLAESFPLAVVTTRRASSTGAFLDSSGISGYFDAVATALTTRRGKPRPDPIIWACQQLDVAPSQCLMVGDTVMDIRAGKAAGAQTLGVLSGFGEEKELLENGADHIRASVSGMEEMFPSLADSA